MGILKSKDNESSIVEGGGGHHENHQVDYQCCSKRNRNIQKVVATKHIERATPSLSLALKHEASGLHLGNTSRPSCGAGAIQGRVHDAHTHTFTARGSCNLVAYLKKRGMQVQVVRHDVGTEQADHGVEAVPPQPGQHPRNHGRQRCTGDDDVE